MVARLAAWTRRSCALDRTPLEVSLMCEPELVRDLIEDSYDLIVSALPRRVRAQLG
jgi:hypothetical protein